MPDQASHRPRVLAIDAGGTMTDTFIVDEAGAFVVGKAQTTPTDESEGFVNSNPLPEPVLLGARSRTVTAKDMNIGQSLTEGGSSNHNS